MLEKCCSSLPRSRRILEKCCSSLPRSDSMRSKSTVFIRLLSASAFAQLHFAPLGSVAFELAARTLSASLRPRPGRAERKRTDPDKPSLPRDVSQGGAADACCTPSPLGLAGALDLAARARSASLGRSTGQSRTKTNRTRQAKLTRRRFAGQDHGCLLHSTQRRTYSVHGIHGYALYIYIYIVIRTCLKE